jgi:phenylacetate-CoA ligase
MKTILLICYAQVVEFVRRILFFSNSSTRLLFVPGMNRMRKFNGIARSYLQFLRAKRRVPAYREFLKSKNFKGPRFKGLLPQLHEIPETDKENYVKIYDIDARAIGGRLPENEVIIDESSGSSGTATNWVRGSFERKRNAKMIQFGIRNLFGKEPLFIINAFALGAWATGINVAMTCVKFAKIKSPGPDIVKIENTLKQFGKKHKYIVMGYPPFLKTLVDQSGIDWTEYDVSFIFGGESMSEGVRDYLVAKGIRKVYSSLGASDLELNMSGENDFTISLRKLIRDNKILQQRLLRFGGALPMIFQYHPADFLIESSSKGELIITICRPGYVSPKIRYNIHDRGHVIDLKELYAIIDKLNIDRSKLVKPQTDLPILFHYGRSDMTVSFFGANISPVDINEVIFLMPQLAAEVSSFCISALEDESGNKNLIVHLELQNGLTKETAAHAKIEKEFFSRLATVNQDFREALRMTNQEQENRATVSFYSCMQGPFANKDNRIKTKYIN